MNASGAVVGSARLEPSTPSVEGVGIHEAWLGTGSQPIPLISVLETADPSDTDGTGDTDRDSDGDPATNDPDDPTAPPGEGDGGSPGIGPTGGIDSPIEISDRRFSCVPRARLHVARRGAAEDVDITFAVTDGTGWITAGNLHELESQVLEGEDGPPLDGLALEGFILSHPQITALTATPGEAGLTIERDTKLDRLDLGDLDQEAVAEFFNARVALFATLESISVHAIGAGQARVEAERYVSAYAALLATIDPSGPFRAEYERILLCDSVTDIASGDILLAPSNPVTVAFLLDLESTVFSWVPRATEVLPGDEDAMTPRHLLPTFALGNVWYESVPGSPLLWRRFRRQTGTAARGDHQDGYITRRVMHFLRVYPHYRDPRQVLSLTFHEPGNGESVLKALRSLFQEVVDGRLTDFPQLQITLVSSSRRETILEQVLSGTSTAIVSDKQVTTDRALRDGIRVTVVPPGTTLLPFSHITFVFRSPLQRESASVDLGDRSGTLWARGLAARPGRLVKPGRNETTFAWGTFTGTAPAAGLPQLVKMTLALVGGMPRDHLAPDKTRMPSTRVSTAFLTEVYDNSVWVVHLDRLLGLEAFAPDASGVHTRYLIDYEDRAEAGQPGLDAITATGRVEPYRLALKRALSGLGQPTDAALDRILRLFNSVSGRWALDVVGANPNDLHERVGLAAAIACCADLDEGFVGGQDWLGVMVPVKELLDSLPKDLPRPSGQHSDDLLYLRVPLRGAPVVISARLLEVKYRTTSDAAAPNTARKQLEAARSWLDKVFNGRGPGRAFRARDMAELIRGAVTRGESFGLLTVHDRPSLEAALDRVSEGNFTLDLRYGAGAAVLGGDFVSIEADSSVAAHRQPLEGAGTNFGHVRLGRPVLEALASGRPLPTPGRWTAIDMPAPAGAIPSGNATDGAGVEPDVAAAPVRHSDSTDLASGPSGADGAESTAVATVTGSGEDDPPVATPWRAGAESEIETFAPRLDAAFSRYGLSVEPFDPGLAQAGPSLLRFRTRALGRLSITEVERRERDISREVGAAGALSVGDEPGFITVDVPRSSRQPLPLSVLLPALDAHVGEPGALNFIGGLAPSGEIRIEDLSRLPHLLVAGATGSGKSVFLRGMLIEMLRARTVDELSLLIIDPKRLDFAAFGRAAHLRGGRIIHDPDEALTTLQDTLEMELAWRQPILEQAGVTSASEFYQGGGRLDELPQVVILVDEFADLVLSGSNPRAFSELVQRYAQLTRAYGIFLVLATQRPSVDVITGSIKANLSARIAFSLPSARDSMTVLDKGGAEDLLGNGDLLFYRNGRTERLQAPLVTVNDVRQAIP
jgi:hypothetical protein